MPSSTEKHSFQADVNEVLSIVVNSLYSHKEVFLRELVSNASDALDQLSFQALTQHELRETGGELSIQILPDRTQRSLTIRDNGVGMSHDEMVENLGTIARSGSRELMKSLAAAQKEKLSLIGQFGVGFYSGYLVAHRVEVISRKAGSDEAWRWISEAKGTFLLEPAEREGRGTDIILYLKEEEDEFLEEWTLRSLVRKYSDFVRYPIQLQVERKEKEEGEDTDDEAKGEGKTVLRMETVNAAKALWTRPRTELDDAQYNEFYKHLSHDWQDPLAHVHFKVEGTQELTGLLYLPRSAPLDLMERRTRGVRLFVRRVFIMDDAEELLPEWLRFVRGLVDSQDLPLNVSREILQQDHSTRFIRKQIIQKVLGLLEELAAEGETTRKDAEGNEETVRRYEIFWKAFGPVLKEGVHFDPDHHDRLCKLFRYPSSHVDGLTGLEDYVKRMQEKQPGIYFVTAENLQAAQLSPHIESLRKQGYEVIYMIDPVDEWVMQSLREFDGKKLIAAGRGDLDLPESDEDKKEIETQQEEFEGVLEQMQKLLHENVQKVRLTHRLTESPACLVTDAQGISPHMERLLRANGRDVPVQKRILELNPGHPIIEDLLQRGKSDPQALEQWTQLLFDQALVAEGSLPENPAEFARRLTRLMQAAAAAGGKSVG